MRIKALVVPNTDDAALRTQTSDLNRLATPALFVTAEELASRKSSRENATYPLKIHTVLHRTSPSGVTLTHPLILEFAFASMFVSTARESP